MSKKMKLNLASFRCAGFTVLSLGLLALSAALPAGLPWAHAAGVEALRMNVSIQPEYDDPRVLVINQGELAPDVKLPVDVTFNIPKGAEIGMACEVTPSGGHSCKPYRIADQGDYQSLTFNVATYHKIFFEYYYQAFSADAGQRSFDFVFRPGFPVKSLLMEVQQPLRSSSFTLTPSFEQGVSDAQGFIHFTREYQDVLTGKALTVNVSYNKTDNRPSLTPQPQTKTDNAPLPVAAAGNKGKLVLLVVLALAGLGILLFAGYRTFRSEPAESRARTGAAGKRTSDRGVSPQMDQGERSVKFCTSCGTQLGRGDRFCSHCGAKQG